MEVTRNTICLPRGEVESDYTNDISPCTISLVSLANHLTTAQIQWLFNCFADRFIAFTDQEFEDVGEDRIFATLSGAAIQLNIPPAYLMGWNITGGE